MSVVRHTPGPWKATNDHPECQTIWYVRPATGSPYSEIATLYAQDSGANARLIAAAPELLETLKRIDRACTYPENDFMRTVRDVARAAIAKAEGT